MQTPLRRTDLVQLFFASHGRMGRAAFAGAAAVLIIVLAIYDMTVFGMARRLTGWLVIGLLLFSGACVISKRMHDRGRSGWWAVPILIAFGAVWPLPPSGFIAFLCSLVLLWAAIEMGLMGGEEGANRFGPPPGADEETAV